MVGNKVKEKNPKKNIGGGVNRLKELIPSTINDDKIKNKSINPINLKNENHINLEEYTINTINRINSFNSFNSFNQLNKINIFCLNDYKKQKEISEELDISVPAIFKHMKGKEEYFDIKIIKGVNHYKTSHHGLEEINIIMDNEEAKQIGYFNKVKYESSFEATELIDLWYNFLDDEKYKEKILSLSDDKDINIDFNKLSNYNPGFSEDLLNNPEENLKAGSIAITQFEDNDNKHEFADLQIRVFNLPESENYLIGDFRSKHLNKFIQFKGIINSASDIRPQTTSAKFECPACGNIISVLQLEQIFKEPTSCGCGRKGKFRLLDKCLIDVQRLVLEEETEDLKGRNNPRKINLLLKNDLTNPGKQAGYNQGCLLTVTGILNEIPISSKTGGKLTRFDFVIDANHIKTAENIEDMTISKEEKDEIQVISKRKDLIPYISNSIAPHITGNEDIKTSLALARIKASKIYPLTKDRIHILMVSDPAQGKSQMGESICDLTKNSRMASSLNSSEVGLTGTVIKDEFLGTWTVKAGAIPLANKSICFVDEIDKFSKDKGQFKCLNGAMEEGKIRIDKGDVHQTLNAETTIISACNPSTTNERFDLVSSENLFKQIGLSGSMLDRYDYIWAIIQDGDKNIFDEVINNRNVDVLEKKMLSKYLFFSSNIKPAIPKAVFNIITSECDRLRKCYSIDGFDFGQRQFHTIIRSSIALSKIKLKKVVSDIEVKEAFRLLIKSLESLKIELPEEVKTSVVF